MDDWEDIPVNGASDWEDVPSEKANDWEEVSKTKPDQISPLTSGAIGATQGATMGWADEIYGALKGTTDYGLKHLANLTSPQIEGVENPDPSWKESYRENQKSAEQFAKDAENQNPKSYFAGEVGGTAAMLATPVGKAVGMSRAAGAGANIAKSALFGGTYGAGRSEGGSENLPSDITTGALTGLLAGVGSQALSGAAKVSPEKLRELSTKAGNLTSEKLSGSDYLAMLLDPKLFIAKRYGPLALEKTGNVAASALESPALQKAIGTTTSGVVPAVGSEEFIDYILQRRSK